MKIVLIIIGAWLLFTIVAVIMAASKQRHLNNYKEVYKGMPLPEAIKLLGKDYKKEELPKYDKYEWEIKSSKNLGISKVVIHVVNDKVTDIQATK